MATLRCNPRLLTRHALGPIVEASILQNMNRYPTPDDGSGLIGDIRSFQLDDVEWRAFEYVSPVAPYERQLIVTSPDAHHSAPVVPQNWRTLGPTDLFAYLALFDGYSAFP